jgi:titin
VIVGNSGYGVERVGWAPYQSLYPVTANLVIGNQIENNSRGGVRIYGAAVNNTIGGTTAAGNVISANGGPGVVISDSGTAGNAVAGNFIGTNAGGTANLGNGGPGVLIENGAANNTVGGTGAGNTIAFNGAGVVVQDNGTIGDAIRGNSLHDNSAIGIGLDGTTFVANDSQGHTGPNLFQDYPVLQKATINASGDLVVSCSVPAADTSATYPLAIDFYLADATGQGEIYLGSDSYAAGVQSVDLGNAAALGAALGDTLVATATDSLGNTSEFTPSAGNMGGTVIVPANQPPVAIAGGPYLITYGASITLDASASSDPDGDSLSYSWTINGHAGAASGVNPTLTWTQLQALGVISAQPFSISVTADDGHGASTTSASVQVTVLPAATSTSAAVSAGTLNFGQAVTFTATVTANAPRSAIPNGVVDFFDTTTQTDLGNVSLSSGTASLTTSTLPTGPQTISVSYLGNANFLASSTTLTVSIKESIYLLNSTASGELNASGNNSINIAGLLLVDSIHAQPLSRRETGSGLDIILFGDMIYLQ